MNRKAHQLIRKVISALSSQKKNIAFRYLNGTKEFLFIGSVRSGQTLNPTSLKLVRLLSLKSANTESVKTVIPSYWQEIKRLPTYWRGRSYQALHYSPVQGANDGNTGFYVRGGNVDQNLILLDNAVVYNPSHILGFFSVFNTDIISSASLIKSGMPANFGGRISSVLTVKTIDGDYEKHTVTAGLGLIYSKATLQGPLVKNKISYYISFRKTYINEIVKPIVGFFMQYDPDGILSNSRYGMYDINAKLTFKIGSRNRIGLTAYKGRDNFGLSKPEINYESNMDWGKPDRPELEFYSPTTAIT
jgi:hypothetical protein